MLAKLAATPIRDIVQREPVRVKANTELLEAVGWMKDRDRGAVIVEDDAGRVIGIFTERDVVRRLDHSDKQWRKTPIAEVMTSNPTTVPASAPIADALRLMYEGTFRHIPIVDDNGRGLGIVSVRDILTYIADFFPEEFVNLPPDPAHESSRRWGG